MPSQIKQQLPRWRVFAAAPAEHILPYQQSKDFALSINTKDKYDKRKLKFKFENSKYFEIKVQYKKEKKEEGPVDSRKIYMNSQNKKAQRPIARKQIYIIQLISKPLQIEPMNRRRISLSL